MSHCRSPAAHELQTSFAKDDFRNIVPRFSPEARKANHGLVEFLASIAETKRAGAEGAFITGSDFLMDTAFRTGKSVIHVPGTDP